MASRIEALGLDPDFAELCACRIGDTPMTCEGSIWVMDENHSVLAVLPERKVYDGVEWRWKGAPDVVLSRGKIDLKQEHVALCAGRRVLARLAPKDASRPDSGHY